jgi:hypothetical protein
VQSGYKLFEKSFTGPENSELPWHAGQKKGDLKYQWDGGPAIYHQSRCDTYGKIIGSAWTYCLDIR